MAQAKQQYKPMHPIMRSMQKRDAKKMLERHPPAPDAVADVRKNLETVLNTKKMTPELRKAIAAGAARAWYADIPGAATDIAGLLLDYGVEGLKSIMPGPELTGYNLEKDLKVDQLQRGLRDPFLGYQHLERVGEKAGYIPPTTGTDAEFMARLAAGIVDPVMVGGAAGTTARQITKASKAADAKPIFTSPGGAAAADIAKETIPANKVRSQLEGRGVNKDEMEWTGFNEWIKTKKGEVSKAEIEEFFAQNQIEVREVVRGPNRGEHGVDIFDDAEEVDLLARDQTADELYALMTNDEILYRNRNTIEPLIQRYKDGDDTVREQLNEWYGGYGYDDQNYIDTYFEQRRGEIETSFEKLPLELKFSDPSWQLPGGENYRELVLMVPPKKVPWTKENVIPITADDYTKSMSPKEWSGSQTSGYWFFKTPDGVERITKKQNKATDYLIDVSEELPPKVDITQEQALEQLLTRDRPEPKPRYTGGHFEENDVVAHIRFNERVDPDGNKVLFIEEIQGDWAHKGQEKGFMAPGSKDKLNKELAETETQLDNYAKELITNKKTLPDGYSIKPVTAPDPTANFALVGPDGIGTVLSGSRTEQEALEQAIAIVGEHQFPGGTPKETLLHQMQNIFSPEGFAKTHEISLEESHKIFDLAAKRYQTKQLLEGIGSVERGPFVTDTHQWTNLALKRMIRWGSDNGFDSIAWVTGKQSADRYNVSKVVDELNIKKSPDDKGYVVTGFKGGVSQNVGHKIDSLDELDAVIGKDLAEKARKDLPELEKTPGGKISPLNLKNSEITESITQYIITIPKGDEGLLMFSNRDIGQRGRNSFQVGKGTVGSKEEAMEYFERYLTNKNNELSDAMKRGEWTPTNTEYDGVSYSGLDLELGGDYHKLIYDQVLTAQAKKIGKKHGAKVEQKAPFEPDMAALEKEWNELSARRNESLRRGKEGVVDYEFTPEDERRLEEVVNQLDFTDSDADIIGNVWTMPLTDKLKQASKDGMPYYVALPPLVIGGAATQRTDAQKQQSKSDAQAILAN